MSATAKKKSKSLSTPAITESELAKWFIDHEAMTKLRKQVKAIEADMKRRNDDLVARFEVGAINPSKRYSASVSVMEKRNVSWKDEFIRLTSEAKAEEVLEKTIPDTYKYFTVSPIVEQE
jgi:hypothetical protein